MSVLPHVYMLSFCRRAELLYGSTLTFETLRIGFPRSPIHIIDNASLPEHRERLRQGAVACGASFQQLGRRINHATFLEQVLSRHRSGQVVFVDTDLCFWQPVEEWTFEELMAGRLIPMHRCEFTGCIAHARLHTSFLWVSDVGRLRDRVRILLDKFPNFHPLRSAMHCIDGTWHFWDTGSAVFSALPQEMRVFSEKELDAYDHLFCGTHADVAEVRLASPSAAVFSETHRLAKTDYRLLRGVWRKQDQYFCERSSLV